MSQLNETDKPKTIRKICLVSATLFNLSALLYDWTAPIGAALGCVATLTNDWDQSISKEFQDTIDEALVLTKENTTSSSHLVILDELVSSEINFNNLSDIIKKTEKFQTQYCTDVDVKEIVDRFEMYFRERISYHPNLSRAYILSTGFVTLEQLQRICETIYANEDALKTIHIETVQTTQYLHRLDLIITVCANEIAFILVSMALFLFVGILSETGFSQYWIFSALFSYTVSSFLMHYLEKSGYAIDSLYKNISFKEFPMGVITRIITLVLPSLISLACFLILLNATSINYLNYFPINNIFLWSNEGPSLLIASAALMSGSLLGRVIRLKTNKDSVSDK